MIKVHKTKASGKYLYINLHGFRDEIEQDIVYQKIKRLLKESQGRIKIF